MNNQKIFPVVIEVLKGSNEKYELDEKDGKIKLDFVFSAVGGSASGGKLLTFPFFYGYLPNTRGGDGDMLDACILSNMKFSRGQEILCRAIGYAHVIDRGQTDDKLIVVPVEDESYKNYLDISDVSKTDLELWKNFWTEVAKQKNKIMSVENFYGKEEAEEIILKANLSK